MDTKIADELKHDATFGPAVENADKVLRNIMKDVRRPPLAAWRPSARQPVSAVELELVDEDDAVVRDIPLDLLADPRELPFAFTGLWGELIMQAYGKSSERLLEALRELRKEEEKRELQLQGA